MNTTFAQLRAEAAGAALSRIRHLLHPGTVHLLSVQDMAEAIAAANDILAPGEAEQAQVLQEQLQEEIRAHSRSLMQRDDALRHAEEALSYAQQALAGADALAYAVAALIGRDIGDRGAGNDPWSTALQIVDEIADANNRPRPSNQAAASRYGKAVRR